MFNKKPNAAYNPLEIEADAKCLCLAPHPDDESIGCGGLLIKHPKQFEVIVLTDGAKGGNSTEEENTRIRLEELDKAMEYAGITKYKNLMVPDRKLRKNLNILKTLDLIKYDYVFIPSKYETHVDHYCIFDKVKEILRWSPKTKIMTYEVWSAQPNPNLYFDISDIYENKKTLIEKYPTATNAINYQERTLALNFWRGMKCNNNYVEAYRHEKTFLQHFLPLFSFAEEQKRFLIYLLGFRISIHKPKK